ncbi:toll/interleukin-1 receptor domain-containing protein [bacterium]|nr:toll/interleukin-1 receptor domain-containing protein [bacterium]
MDTYRIFISYSHEDIEFSRKIVNIFEDGGFEVLWDKNFQCGQGFHDQIRNYISHSHVFVPILTEASNRRGWVHQEIGYAMAIKIPVFPIAYGKMPDEMLYGLQAFIWEGDEKSMKKKLLSSSFKTLIEFSQANCRPFYECAEFQEDRLAMMVDYASRVIHLDKYGHFRQSATLSVFHVPPVPISDPVWIKHYGTKKASPSRMQGTLKERLVMERHARKEGCSLIIHPYQKELNDLGKDAKITRIKMLLDFLHSMPNKVPVFIAIKNEEKKFRSITCVGDWFAAESISGQAGEGWEQTIFTRHAPTIQSTIESFDRELRRILENQGIEPKDSKKHATQTLKKIILKTESEKE